MNDTCALFNLECARRIGPVDLIVELGSYNVNGSVRTLWQAKRYIGVDTRPGPEVDVVADGCVWQPDELADVVVCNNAVEHCGRPERMIANAYAMLKDSGYLVLTMPHIGWPPHGVNGGKLAEGEHYGNVDASDMARWLKGWGDMEMTAKDGIVRTIARKRGRLPAVPEGKAPPPVAPRAGRGFVFCTDCNRVLFPEDGPTCPECMAKRAKAES